MKKFLNKLKNFIKYFSKPIISRVKSGELRRRDRYARYYKKLRIKENVILYESFLGQGVLDNPYAIFKRLLTTPRFSNYIHVWSIDDFDANQHIINQYRYNKNVRFVKYQSKQYLKYLCSAHYLINNNSFPTYYTKKDGQIYVNTWHGIPLKTLGYDMENGKAESHNVVRSFLQSDYLVSANSFLTKIYLDSYKMRGLYTGKIIEEGYPRVNLISTIKKDELLNKLKAYNVKVDKGKKVILYAPTWKGKSWKNPEPQIDDYRSLVNSIMSNIDESKYQVLVKLHYIEYNMLKKNNMLGELNIIPPTIDINEVFSIVDILVSDYSSLYFDFLITNKPILFYIPDVEHYQNQRGLYFGTEMLPGPITKDKNDISKWINDIDNIQMLNREKYKRVQEWVFPKEKDGIVDRVVNIVFDHKEEQYNVLSHLDQSKRKILFHHGPMLMNGISTSLLNLLNYIDYEKYDVSVTVLNPKSKEQVDLINKINPNVRVFVRKTTWNVTLLEEIICKFFINKGKTNKFWSKFYLSEVYRKEFKRSYGDAKFDYTIDFAGYTIYYSLIHLNSGGAITAIFQHNDMFAEQQLKYPHLKALFSIYPMFDKIISCSKAIMEVNRKNLATEETYNKFVYAKNMVDYERVLKLKDQGQIYSINGVPNLFIFMGERGKLKKGKLIALEEQKYGTTQVEDTSYKIVDCTSPNAAVKSTYLLPCSSDNGYGKLIRFIAVGRLSPEKNYINLIKAFRRFIDQGYNAMLYVLGDGPQKKQIEKQIAAAELKSRIILTGNLPNPFAVMKECDCFILPSLHEGQPMVINEARILKKPIIMTEFSSAAGSTIPNGQFIIEKTVEGILEGLVAFVEGRVPSDYEFDGETYNKEAYEEFLTALDLIPQAETMVSNQ